MVCLTWEERRLSWAAIMASFFYSTKSQTVRYSMEVFDSHSIALGMWPAFRKKGANPVLSNLAELMTNSMAGSFTTQSFWFRWMHCRSIWVIIWLTLSVKPSDCGWYALDSHSLVPISRWSCFQNVLVNRTSISLIYFLVAHATCTHAQTLIWQAEKHYS